MDPKSLRIVYLGTPEFAVAPLRALVGSGHNVVAVVTAPDKPAGRGLTLREPAVKHYAVSAGIPVLQPGKLKDPAFVEQFEALDADLGIVVAFRMLPEMIWGVPRRGTFNLHASLLPDYRGAAPINRALINGETETGVTTFMLNHEIDKGDILGQVRVLISPEDDAGTLHDKLMEAGTGLVLETVERIARGDVTPIPQPQTDSPKEALKIFKENCRIDWHCPATIVANLIRGLSPYPAAWCELEPAGGGNQVMLKIYRALKGETTNGEIPGTVRTDGRKTFAVACADNWLDIRELQPAGKRRMETEEFLRGFKNLYLYRCL